MSKNLKLVKRIAAVATTVCVVAGLMVSASAYGITVPAEGRFVYDGTESSVTVPVTGTSSSGQVTIVVRKDNDNWLTDPNNNVVFIDQVTGADGATSITFGIDNKWLAEDKQGEYKIFVGGSSQAVTSADIYIGGDVPPPPAPTLSSIAVSGQKTNYTVGDEFVAPTVTATYSDGSTAVVDATFSGFDSATAGTKTITVKYEDQTITYDITVREPAAPGQATFVAKLKYNFGDATKAVIEATIADNGAKKVMVGDAELYYNAERGVYVGIIAATDVEGETIKNVSILDEAPATFKYGNVNNDNKGTINAGDLLQLKLYMQSKTTFDGVKLLASDVNGDGRINAGDLLQLKLYMQNGQQFGALTKQ